MSDKHHHDEHDFHVRWKDFEAKGRGLGAVIAAMVILLLGAAVIFGGPQIAHLLGHSLSKA